MKPLTIDELKALPVGDWVWVVDEDFKGGMYREITIQNEIEPTLFYVSSYSNPAKVYNYSDYGKTWLAYKNKEFAKSKSEWVELPCKVGDPIWVVYEHCDNGYLEYDIHESVCIGFNIRNTSVHVVTNFCCHDIDRHGNFTDKSEAERQLAELKGEKV